MLGFRDDRFVSIVVAEVNVGFLLERRVEVAVVDAQRDELNVFTFDGSLGYSCVL